MRFLHFRRILWNSGFTLNKLLLLDLKVRNYECLMCLTFVGMSCTNLKILKMDNKIVDHFHLLPRTLTHLELARIRTEYQTKLSESFVMRCLPYGLCTTPKDLSGLPAGLQKLSLRDSGVTNEQLWQLSPLSSLEVLDLVNAKSSIVHLINLTIVDITDNGLKKLPSSLRALNVLGCKHLSKKVVKQLRDKIPSVLS